MARSTMADLIERLRGMTNASNNDYSVGLTTYWSDDHLQDALDAHGADVYRHPTKSVETYNAGTVQWKNYYLGASDVEQTSGGSAVFYLEDAAGSVVGTALYSADYRTGHVAFSNDTGGSSYYWYGRSYDLNRSAADVWRQKGAYHAQSFDFTTDNHSVKRSAVYKQCLDMAAYYDSQSQTGGMIDVMRGDTPGYGYADD